jgi:hypothetical protein
MKLLLDECVTRFLKRDLVGHVDRNLPFQQNINTLPMAVMLLIA